MCQGAHSDTRIVAGLSQAGGVCSVYMTYRRLALAEKQMLPKLAGFQRSWNIEYEQVHTEEGSRQGEDPRSWVTRCIRKITAG